MLLAPKLLSYLVLLARLEERRGCGGGGRAFLSLVAETLNRRADRPGCTADAERPCRRDPIGPRCRLAAATAVPLGQVVRRHTLLGLLLGGTAWLVSPYLALWMLPVVLGLALAIPLAAFSAATGPGEAFRRLGLLRIPEEVRPPATLAKANTRFQ